MACNSILGLDDGSPYPEPAAAGTPSSGGSAGSKQTPNTAFGGLWGSAGGGGRGEGGADVAPQTGAGGTGAADAGSAGGAFGGSPPSSERGGWHAGNGAASATTGGSDGGAGGSGASGGAAGSSGGADNPWQDVLHGKVEALSGGRIRVTYDFSDPAQLADWDVPEVYRAQISLYLGQLRVRHLLEGDNRLGQARWLQPIRMDRVSLTATSIGAENNISVYFNTRVDYQDYGVEHRYDGLGWILSIVRTNIENTEPVMHAKRYELEVTSGIVEGVPTLTVTGNQVSATRTLSYVYDLTDRYVFVGGTLNDVLFDDIVIEGLPGEPRQ